MPTLELKPTHKAVVAYYEALAKFDKLGVKHEGAVASAFEDLLDHCARLTGRVLIPKYSLKRKGAKPIIPDAAVVDSLSQVLRYGLWEAKDTGDDLDKEIKAKFKAGYPRDNMLFQEPRRAVLYQNGERFFDLAAQLGRDPDLVSKHLRVLRDVGVVVAEQDTGGDGRRQLYEVPEEFVTAPGTVDLDFCVLRFG